MNRKNRRRKGFTLVELLVVIVIISMLAALVAPNVFKHLAGAKRDICPAKMALIEDALNRFYLDCGRFPDDTEGLEALITAPEDLEDKWNGRYLKPSQLLDPWENEFIYIAEGEYNPGSFDLISLGSDGQPEGEGDAEDIINGM